MLSFEGLSLFFLSYLLSPLFCWFHLVLTFIELGLTDFHRLILDFYCLFLSFLCFGSLLFVNVLVLFFLNLIFILYLYSLLVLLLIPCFFFCLVFYFGVLNAQGFGF
ncbi:hypothetical protein HPLT_05695 [Helicobacter pylori Lithuania75]|nr:hypothetical protein HPLT_05695 [Helicobacter pylori Lithuania75]